MDAAGMERAQNAAAAVIKRAWVAALQHLRAENPVESIAIRMHSGEPIVGLDAAIASFAAAERHAYATVGAQTAMHANAQLHTTAIRKKVIYFDDEDRSVMSWAERNRYDLIRGLTQEQRVMVRFAMSVAQETGENPLVTATRIRDEIGLTEAQARAVESYRQSLVKGRYADALQRKLSDGRSDRTIRRVRDQDLELTDAQLEGAVSRYRQNMLVLRSETIARTESQRIAHQASGELYRQAIARGDIQAEQIEQEWLHHPSKKSEFDREFHISMHGQKRPWGEPFESGLGNLLMFPGDPDAPPKETIRCACTRTVRIVPSRAA
jgi:hypothetical protein